MLNPQSEASRIAIAELKEQNKALVALLAVIVPEARLSHDERKKAEAILQKLTRGAL
jgi:hypothetical protein